MQLPRQLSPELVLVDPELAAWARGRLPELDPDALFPPRPRFAARAQAVTERRRPVPADNARGERRGAAPVRRPARTARSIEGALLVVLAVFAAVIVAAAAAHERQGPTGFHQPPGHCRPATGQPSADCPQAGR